MAKFRSDERTTVYDGSKGLRVDLGRGETVDLTGDAAKLVSGVDSVSKVTPAKKKSED
jgi:hypothetical protein